MKDFEVKSLLDKCSVLIDLQKQIQIMQYKDYLFFQRSGFRYLF